MPIAGSEPVHTVSDLALRVKRSLDGAFDAVWVKGEISNFRAYSSGHWYFTLKDSESQLKGVMFSRDNRRLRFRPSDGDEVLLKGRVDVYTPRGDLQVVARHLEPLGAGQLQKAFEALKAKLAAEGLFDADRKRPIPRVPRRIGIVTSDKAAALQDMLRVFESRDPTLAITLSPSRVQGEGAGREIAAALKLLWQYTDVELILCGRGGGSLEDLWAFNEEVVARAIASSPVPVISCVGHEIDFTISDFVADLRAPTPSAAAEVAVPIRADLEAAVRARVQRLSGAVLRELSRRQRRVVEMRGRLITPRRRVDLAAQRLDDVRQRLVRASDVALAQRRQRWTAASGRLRSLAPRRDLVAARARLARTEHALVTAHAVHLTASRQRLEVARRALYALGPLQALGRGYALARIREGQEVLRDSAQVAIGDLIEVRLARGSLDCRVESVKEPEPAELPQPAQLELGTRRRS